MIAVGDFAPRRFEYGQPAIVQQPFTLAGVDYKLGEPFPYDELKLDRWQVLGLWQGSRIDFAPPATASTTTGKSEKRAARR